ncbi:energy transducer TonB [Microbulbifer sp. 2201CG32-9]|uniref:energy transducer TonB n=1 Tax=Microbulbifer sp. 2201CG32-9 TaxID=3232309 RepID=UPI00345B70C2
MFKPLIYFILLLKILFFSPLLHANFDKAMEIYNTGKFYEAKTAFEALTAIGDRSSLFNLGVMYYRGESVVKNPVKAYVLMRIANDGVGDENFSHVAKSIFAKFDEAQRIEAEQLFVELNTIYNVSEIENNIFPKPLSDADCVPETTPIKKTTPRYPSSELSSGRMGLVHMEFTISPEGYPRDIIATRSTSKDFTKASVKAIKRDLYKRPADGKPIYNHRTIYTYKLEGASVKVRTKQLTRAC